MVVFFGFFFPPPFKEFVSCFLLVIIVDTAAVSCSVEEEFVNRSPSPNHKSVRVLQAAPPPVDHKSVRSFLELSCFLICLFSFCERNLVFAVSYDNSVCIRRRRRRCRRRGDEKISCL